MVETRDWATEWTWGDTAVLGLVAVLMGIGVQLLTEDPPGWLLMAAGPGMVLLAVVLMLVGKVFARQRGER